MSLECPVCGSDDPRATITINNSNSDHAGENLTDQDVTFEVEFPNDAPLTGVYICQDCRESGRYIE